MLAQIAAVNTYGNAVLPRRILIITAITAEKLKEAVEAKEAKIEQTKAGETAVFFRCFVYIMDRRLKAIITIMTLRKYREKYGNFPDSQRVKRLFSPPGKLSFEGVF